MGTVVALGRGPCLGIDIECAVRTGLSAGLAAYAATGIEIHDTVIPLVQGFDRADIDAGRLFAVVAPHDRKIPAGFGETPLFDILDPRPVYPQGHLVLGFAGYRAGMAPDALSGVDHETIVHGQDCSKFGNVSKILR
jgi:hypothetical protein